MIVGLGRRRAEGMACEAGGKAAGQVSALHASRYTAANSPKVKRWLPGVSDVSLAASASFWRP
jgi:hypothetical protein